jgi:hypothetical protein
MWALSNAEIDDYYHGNPHYHGTFSKDKLKGIPKLGYYICNMEKSNKDGSHWITIAVLPKHCLYFDPFGVVPDPMVLKFMKKSKKPIYSNTTDYQNLNSDSCGWWGIYLIDHLMSGIPFETIMKKFSSNTKKNEQILKKYFTQHKLVSKNGLLHGGFINPFKKIYNVGKEAHQRVTHFIKGERNMFPPDVRRAYEKYKDVPIQDLYVARAPINSVIDHVVNLISLGTYKQQKQKLHYDQLFHLFFLIRLNGNLFRLENNHVIEFKSYNNALPNEILKVPLNNRLTFGDFLMNGPKKYPEGFFSYNPIGNNCQDFAVKELRASNLTNPEVERFIKQDAATLFKETPAISKRILQAITNLASRGDILIKGVGIKKKVIRK